MKIETKNGKRVVKENFRKVFYELKYDWPKNTVFNVNNYSKEVRLKFPEIKPNMEIWTHCSGCHSFFGTEKESIEECEETLWKLFQSYINCEEHEFIRDSPTRGHYSNGVGFCKKCGMFKSNAFLPETTCKNCNKPTNSQDLYGQPLCIKCQQELGVLAYGYCRFMTEEYLKRNFTISKFELNTYSLYIQSEKLEVWYYLIPTVDKGVYKLYLRDSKGAANLFKREALQIRASGLIKHGYFVTPEANNLLLKRYKMVGRHLHSDNLEYILNIERLN